MPTLLTVVGRCIKAGKKTKKTDEKQKTKKMEQNKQHCVGDACTVLVSVVADSLYQT